MHLGDSIFIFILALVLFGPKKLPEMARQIGKLMAEFRRASNDFRLQIDEELRSMERQEQQQKQEKERAALVAATNEPSILPPALAGEQAAGNRLTSGSSALGVLGSGGTFGEAGNEAGGSLQILPPSIGEQVSAGTPYAVSASTAATDELGSAEDHPLLRVDSIPIDPHANGNGATGLAAAQANAAQLPAEAVEHGSVESYGPSYASSERATGYEAANRTSEDAPHFEAHHHQAPGEASGEAYQPAPTLAVAGDVRSDVAEAEQAPLPHG